MLDVELFQNVLKWHKQISVLGMHNVVYSINSKMVSGIL